MRIVLVTALLLGHTLLSGCSGPGASEQLGDLSSSVQGGFGRNTDTYGTQRRVDVYGGSTAPTLPSIGAAGFGK